VISAKLRQIKGDTVEHMTLNQGAPYVERLSLALLLPRYLLIGPATLIGGFGMVIMSVVGLMHYASPPSDPFAAYADVFPGQPISALEARGFVCTLWEDDYYHEASERHCSLHLETGDFTDLVAFSSSKIISRISFMIRDNAISMGDLVGWLAISEFRLQGSLLFIWRGNVGVARFIHPNKKFSILRRMWLVTLTDTRLPTLTP
jgi:hypothetical protein